MGPGNELGARRAEQFPHLGNYTLTPAARLLQQIIYTLSTLTGDEAYRKNRGP